MRIRAKQASLYDVQCWLKVTLRSIFLNHDPNCEKKLQRALNTGLNTLQSLSNFGWSVCLVLQSLIKENKRGARLQGVSLALLLIKCRFRPRLPAVTTKPRATGGAFTSRQTGLHSFSIFIVQCSLNGQSHIKSNINVQALRLRGK